MTGLVIFVPVEGRAVWVADARTEAELARLYDWLTSSPAVLLEVATDSLALLNLLVSDDDEPEATA
jgi:hypothetical protein